MDPDKYDSPGHLGPGLDMDDFHPPPAEKGADVYSSSPQLQTKKKLTGSRKRKEKMQPTNYQQYGNWHEYNRFYTPGGPIPMHEIASMPVMPTATPHMNMMEQYQAANMHGSEAKASRRQRPHSTKKTGSRARKNDRFRTVNLMGAGMSPPRAANMSLILPQMMPPPMTFAPPQGAYFPMDASAGMFTPYQQSMAET